VTRAKQARRAYLLLLMLGSVSLCAAENLNFRLGIVASFEPSQTNVDVPTLALKRIPEILGIPYGLAQRPEDLSHYPVAVLAAGPSNANLQPAWQEALYRFVEDGGVLLCPGPVGSDLYPLFGIAETSNSRKRYRLTFDGQDPAFAYIDHPREKTISLGNGEKHIYDEVIRTHAVKLATLAEPLGWFDDSSIAFSRNYYGRGIAYYLGISFEEAVLLPQTGGDFEAQRRYVNSFEPSADVIMLLVKALYEAYTQPALCVSVIPEAKPTALILTHDVDAQTSFVDSLKFADVEASFHTTGTYFENTKYFTDAMDIGYYALEANKTAIRKLAARGFDIGSHTVSHSYDFDSAAVGSPDVTQQTYRPREKITINGEVRVSKALLDRDIPGQDTVSFRSGYLAFPPELIRVLEDAGYRYDSSFSACDVLSSFPFYAFRERRPGSQPSNVIEIPVTLDDSRDFLTPYNVASAEKQWEEVFDANMGNGGITVLLIHPSDTRDRDFKLRAQRALMTHAQKADAWMGNLTEFGRFYRQRSTVTLERVVLQDGVMTITLNQRADQMHPWTGIVVTAPAGVKDIMLADASGNEIPTTSRHDGPKTVLTLRLQDSKTSP